VELKKKSKGKKPGLSTLFADQPGEFCSSMPQRALFVSVALLSPKHSFHLFLSPPPPPNHCSSLIAHFCSFSCGLFSFLSEGEEAAQTEQHSSSKAPQQENHEDYHGRGEEAVEEPVQAGRP